MGGKRDFISDSNDHHLTKSYNVICLVYFWVILLSHKVNIKPIPTNWSVLFTHQIFQSGRY